jgi:hypothetical protein
MRMFNDFEEIKAAVGTEVGVSDWVEVTQQRIDQFAEATRDEQWIHVDVERAARELPGRTTICPLSGVKRTCVLRRICLLLTQSGHRTHARVLQIGRLHVPAVW